jgi:enamine deaminase RidA (YjgF/YER057c/UK114 family)
LSVCLRENGGLYSRYILAMAKYGDSLSQAVIHNGIVYLAGQVATGARGASVAEQTKDVLSNFDVLLAEANSNKGRILSPTIWLTDRQPFRT